jgi:peptidoglycan/xylan/chitin deacetylase (PgdA/CDA1 family)
MSDFKSSLLKLLFLPGATLPFSPLVKERAVVFMLHRFQDPETGVEGHDPQVLRQGLAYLRKQRYKLLFLEELLVMLLDGRPLTRAVVFTIDDGYLEHATVAAPLFAEFDCPVTTFVTTGFLDGRLWFWWDQIEYIFDHSKRCQIQVSFDDIEFRYQWDVSTKSRAKASLTAACKELPDPKKIALIRRVATAAEVEVPQAPPRCYSAMSWDQARACEKGGMTFGPHTVTHPILSRASDAQSQMEISSSWERLSSQVGRPVPVFCYPNGRPQDFAEREIATLKSLKFLGAVAGTPGYVRPARKGNSPHDLFRISRFGYPDDLLHVVQYVSGFERFKQVLRREEVA